jgi:allantoinase
MIRLAEEFQTRVHIVHVSSAEGVAAIASAKARAVRITAETCPHYLTFAADEIGDGATEFKCAPPIRDASHRTALWAGLFSGALDMIATDHSPAPPVLKTAGDFTRAWGGIASLEVSLAATYTSLKAQLSALNAEKSKESVLLSLARWMSAAPASLAGLGEHKGRIAEGFDADLVVWDPAQEFRVDASHLQQRHKLTPYAGRSLFGTILTTFVRGERVWDNNRLARAYGGRLL